jgi:hypothetical protein
MNALQRLLLVGLASALAASGCTTAAGGGSTAPHIDPAWEMHMAAGLGSWELGNIDAAAYHYRRAVRLARSEQLPPEELAFSTYRLGEAIRVRPATSRGETALALLEESRRHLELAYGVDHPVLIPVWVRLAALKAEGGDEEGAAVSQEAADRIALHSFPKSHFLRERYGTVRPGAILHPLEVLELIGASSNPVAQAR